MRPFKFFQRQKICNDCKVMALKEVKKSVVDFYQRKFKKNSTKKEITLTQHGNDEVCHGCGKSGLFKRDCLEKSKKSNKSKKKCFKCGKIRHLKKRML